MKMEIKRFNNIDLRSMIFDKNIEIFTKKCIFCYHCSVLLDVRYTRCNYL